MLQFTNCKLTYKKQDLDSIRQKVAKTLRCRPEELKNLKIEKKSLDARKKPDIFFVYTVSFSVDHEERFLKKHEGCKNLQKKKETVSLETETERIQTKEKVVIVGTGPAGLFCGYYLALCGINPVLLEQGQCMEQRVQTVEKFWEKGELLKDCNVSFGEGGAGTFSDGKLNTGVNDRTGRKRFVLESFVKFGASEEILYDAKPHIGTDVLQKVIRAMREEMKSLGASFLFSAKLVGIQKEAGKITAVTVQRKDGQENLPCDRLILAPGHSARDTFSMLKEAGITMEQKAFAMGVRVEHTQEKIDRIQYGMTDLHLPPSPYKCTGKTKDGRGVYSFCMCPGGYVVNASSEEGGLVVNGMSYAGRDSGRANSAIVVSVEPEDFGSEDILAGVEFQRRLERQMYQLCRGKIPVQTYGAFRQGIQDKEEKKLNPKVKGEWQRARVDKALPKFIKNGIIDGMESFSHKMKGFNDPDTLVLGLESRTSSPVRILRNEEFQSGDLQGLYPCGEGAGYAGGIMSAAMDGLRVAQKIFSLLQECEKVNGDGNER